MRLTKKDMADPTAWGVEVTGISRDAAEGIKEAIQENSNLPDTAKVSLYVSASRTIPKVVEREVELDKDQRALLNPVLLRHGLGYPIFEYLVKSKRVAHIEKAKLEEIYKTGVYEAIVIEQGKTLSAGFGSLADARAWVKRFFKARCCNFVPHKPEKKKAVKKAV